MCLLKKIRVGGSEFFFFLNFIIYNWIDVGWHQEWISTLEEWHLTCFCQNDDPLELDIKN